MFSHGIEVDAPALWRGWKPGDARRQALTLIAMSVIFGLQYTCPACVCRLRPDHIISSFPARCPHLNLRRLHQVFHIVSLPASLVRFGTPDQPLFMSSADSDSVSRGRSRSDDAEGRLLYYRALVNAIRTRACTGHRCKSNRDQMNLGYTVEPPD